VSDIAKVSELAPPKLLVADDDPAIVSLLADRCSKMGFIVETATNGLQLLMKGRRTRPDLMIVDVNMPELDGLSACLSLLHPRCQPVDVIVITGSSDPETIERCGSLGMFYGHKGPEFWPNIEAALAVIFPDMIGKIAELESQPKSAEVYVRPRVLLIDDDPAIQHFYASRLVKLGVDMLYASNAVHGHRIACKARPSVIVTDNYMPDGDAMYLLHRLRRSPETKNVPVIVISGRLIDEQTQVSLRRDMCGQPGAAHIFRKSFDTSELFQALQGSVALRGVGGSK
jgi:CheY-like chemotaxis protein